MSSGSIIFEDAICLPADVLEFESFRAWAHSDDFPEYWLIDARRPAVSFQVLIRSKSRYVPSPSAASGFHTSPVLDRKVRLVRRESQIGLVDYRLLFRPEGPQ